jgi:hypothetical protein
VETDRNEIAAAEFLGQPQEERAGMIKPKANKTIRVRFRDAAEVCLMGEFNNWSTVATRLVHVGSWVWEGTLPPGADLRETGFFVWAQGQRFGRFFRQGEVAPAAAV